MKHIGILLLGLLYTSIKTLKKEANSYMVGFYAIFNNLLLTLQTSRLVQVALIYRYLYVVHFTGGFSVVILSQAVWKRNWVGHDPAQSKMAMDKTVATIGIVAQAQLLTV